MSAIPIPYTYLDYLADDAKSEEKSEFIDGRVYAMAGATFNHGLIKSAITYLLVGALRGSQCVAIDSDIKVRTDDYRMYSYPDGGIACGPLFDKSNQAKDQGDVLLNPTVIFEVLSPSTEAFDRGEKFRRYRTIESLQEYVLVSQTSPAVEVYRRKGDVWILTPYEKIEDSVTLESVNITLKLTDIYERVEFETESVTIDAPVAGL